MKNSRLLSQADRSRSKIKFLCRVWYLTHMQKMLRKTMANYPQELAQDAVCQSHIGHMTGLLFLPARPLRLNTNEWMNYIIFIIYYSSDSPSSLVTESVCLVVRGRLKERCGLEPRTNFLFRLRNRQKLVRIRFGCGLDSRIYGARPLRSRKQTGWSELKKFHNTGICAFICVLVLLQLLQV